MFRSPYTELGLGQARTRRATASGTDGGRVAGVCLNWHPVRITRHPDLNMSNVTELKHYY